MNNRNKLSKQVPVQTLNVNQFLKGRNESDEYHYTKIGNEFLEYVKTKLREDFQITNANGIKPELFFELVKNSYDSYALKGLKLNQYLEMEITVKQKEDKVVVEFRDNGVGFLNQPKGERVPRTSLIPHEKTGEYFGSGNGTGLARLEQNMKWVNANLCFKNRNDKVTFFGSKKDRGATVYMEFKSPRA